MPTLDLSPEDFTSRRNPLVLDRIAAVMIWPNDPLWREKAAEAWRSAAEIEASELRHDATWVTSGPIIGAPFLIPPIRKRVEIDLEFLRSVAASLPMTAIRDAQRIHMANGQRVGLMLLELLGIVRNRKNPSRRMKQIKAHYAKKPPEGVRATSTQSMHKIWKSFQPVAHLWAAQMILMSSYTRERIAPPPPVPCLLGDLERFLAWAEACCIVGEETQFEQSREFLLIAGKTWRQPEGLPVLASEFATHIREIRDGAKSLGAGVWERMMGLGPLAPSPTADCSKPI